MTKQFTPNEKKNKKKTLNFSYLNTNKTWEAVFYC